MVIFDGVVVCLLQCILALRTKADEAVRGVAGVDYPDYRSIPRTSFRCSQQPHIPGLYADPETGCQMFHHCYEHRHESFLCQPGTIFNQAILACDYWYSADCSAVESHYNVNLQHKDIHEGTFVSNKDPSANVFNKMVSLYEEQKPDLDGASYNEVLKEYSYDNRDYSEHTAMDGNQYSENEHLDVSGFEERSHDVLDEADDNHGYLNDDNINFENVESSGEPDDVAHLYSEDGLSENDTDKDIFEKEYFAHTEGHSFEHYAQYFNEEHLARPYVGEKEGKSDNFSKRQSKAIEDGNDTETKRKKPNYTLMEPEIKVHFETTEFLENKLNDNSNYSDNFLPTSPTFEMANNIFDVSIPSKPKRRKPLLVNLEDSLKYNVENTKPSSLKYEANIQLNINGFSMDAEEISMEVHSSRTDHEQNIPMKQLNTESNRNTNENDLNSLASTENYVTSTVPALETTENIVDLSNQLYPKRKRTIIRIIDSEGHYDAHIENEKSIYSSSEMPGFEEVTAKSINTNFGTTDFYQPLISHYHEVQNIDHTEYDPLELITERYEDMYNSIPPLNHLEIHQETDYTYSTEMYPTETLNVKDYAGVKDIEDESELLHLEHDDYQTSYNGGNEDSLYITTELPFTEIPTIVSTDFPHSEDEVTQLFYDPNNDIISNFDDLGTDESISSWISETLDHNATERTDMEKFEFHQLDPALTWQAKDNISKNLDKDLTDSAYRQNIMKQLTNSTTAISEANSSDSGLTNNRFDKELKQNSNSTTSRDVINFELDAESHENVSKMAVENHLNLSKTIFTEPTDTLVENISSDDIHHKLLDSNLEEKQNVVQYEDSMLPEAQYSLKSDTELYLSDSAIEPDVMKNINVKNIQNNQSEVADSETTNMDFEDVKTLNSSSTFTSAENLNPSTENSFDSKTDIELLSDDNNVHKLLSSAKENLMIKQNFPGRIQQIVKNEPTRSQRAFTLPYNEAIDYGALGYPHFNALPYSVLKIKQNSMKNYLSFSTHQLGFKTEGIPYFSVTGKLLKSPKIKKLISLGKKLLLAKKAKLRIFSNYVNN